jgi:hypothetical protein
MLHPGPASGLVIIRNSRSGAVAPEPPYDPFGVWRRRRRQHAIPGHQWVSPLAYYRGPFDDHDGLDLFQTLFGRSSNSGKPLQIYLTAAETGIGIIPAKGKGRSLWLRYEEVASIELRPGSTARMVMMTPSAARKIGEVSIVTKQHRRAELSGIPSGGLYDLLTVLGAWESSEESPN